MASTYKVYDRDGRCRMSTTVGYRYEKEIEMDLLEAGYVIKIDGKKLTKKDVREIENNMQTKGRE